MAGFNEDTRVKVPALMHLTRIGYTYRSLHSLHLDPTTNIDVDTFTKKLKDFNKDITDTQIKLFIGQIQNMLNNEDLGREFTRKSSKTRFTRLSILMRQKRRRNQREMSGSA